MRETAKINAASERDDESIIDERSTDHASPHRRRYALRLWYLAVFAPADLRRRAGIPFGP